MTVFKTSMRNFFAHKGRMALSAVAVLLSVAFVCGTLVFTDTMNATFDKIFSATAPDVNVSHKDAPKGDDVQRTRKVPTIPATKVAELAKVKGVKAASGDVTSTSITAVDMDNKKIALADGAPSVASNWDANETKSSKISSGRAPRGPTEIMVDADTADKKHLDIGDKVRIIAVPGDFTATITGIVTLDVTNPGSSLFYLDDKSAQRQLLGADDAYTSIALTAAPGVSNEDLKQTVIASLGADKDHLRVLTKAETKAENKDDLGSFLDVMKYAMLGFAGIAVLVGIFLIVNTFSMLVAQRTREIGLMRAIGSSRRQVNRSVLFEALLLGIVGSILGVAGGIGLAIGLMKLMGTMGLNLDTSELTIKTATPVVGLVIGVLTTVVAAYIPARRAGKISPMAALRDAGTPADGRAGKVRAVLGLLLTGGGAAGLVMAAGADTAKDGASFLAVGLLLTLIGFIVIGPLLAGVVVRVLSAILLRAFGPVGRMAERNALRNPRRTGATGAALMIGLALVACLSVVGSSMVASASDELDKSVGADFIVQPDNGSIKPQVEQAVKRAKHLDHVSDYKILEGATITTPAGKKVKEDLDAASLSYAEDLRSPVIEGKLADAYGKNAIGVPEGFAKDNKIRMGDVLTVRFAESKRTAKLTVKVITSEDTAFNKGALYIGVETAQDYVSPDQMPQNIMMFAVAKDGQDREAYASIKAELKGYPDVTVRDQADYKKLLEDQIGQLLNLVYGLLGLAIIVAILGVVNTLALSVVERTREIGLMRAIGLSRRQMRRMIRLESVVIALFGALLGLGLGMAWGITAQKLLALEGLKTLEIPWPTIGTVFVGAAVVGLLAALVPAFRAGRMNVLNAIATD
ncbi:ABC transporter permease [Streptomyces sp. 796.1]|uniref:ABC transporter permease n=1 Tax=Streptomyces sp. 796.1 TaxID=3163029 RepID=UPI0039C9573F